MQKKIKVLIVDDSALVRALLTDLLEANNKLTVCGTASDPFEAREKIKALNPDVLTLDIEMPKMNGITFLKNLMRLRPMPVVMISTLTQDGAPSTLQALELGAVDFVAKPKHDGDEALANYAQEICAKVLAAAKANVRSASDEAGIVRTRVALEENGRDNFICAIGASTGGTEAIKDVISVLPINCPPIVIAQHIPESFSSSFARRVDSLSAPKVHEAAHHQIIEAGNVYIAPGHSHLRVHKTASGYQCTLDKDEPVNRHRPAVEVLFDSVRKAAGLNAVGVLLTGMGADGARALLRFKELGATTIVQDEASSVVWGMPRAAVNLGAADKILDIHKVASAIMAEYVKK